MKVDINKSKQQTSASHSDGKTPHQADASRTQSQSASKKSRPLQLLVCRYDQPEFAARQALRVLAQTGRYYLMAGEMVELVTKDDIGAPCMCAPDWDELASVLSQLVMCVWVDVQERKSNMDQPFEFLVELIHWHRPYDELPVLAGVVNGSAYRKDGTVIAKAGYDKASGLYLFDPTADPAKFDSGDDIEGELELHKLLAALGA